MDYFSDLFIDYVWSPVVDTLEYLWDFVIYCFVQLWDLICDFTLTCSIAVLDLLPDINILSVLEGSDVSSYFGLISTLNLFFPLVEMFELIGIFILAVFTYAVIKLVIKLIPTIG